VRRCFSEERGQGGVRGAGKAIGQAGRRGYRTACDVVRDTGGYDTASSSESTPAGWRRARRSMTRSSRPRGRHRAAEPPRVRPRCRPCGSARPVEIGIGLLRGSIRRQGNWRERDGNFPRNARPSDCRHSRKRAAAAAIRRTQPARHGCRSAPFGRGGLPRRHEAFAPLV